MRKIVNTITPRASFFFAGKEFIQVRFTFADAPIEIFNVPAETWVKILKLATEVSSAMPLHEIKKEIYYAAVMDTAEFSINA